MRLAPFVRLRIEVIFHICASVCVTLLTTLLPMGLNWVYTLCVVYATVLTPTDRAHWL